jgi:hypothetical protein
MTHLLGVSIRGNFKQMLYKSDTEQTYTGCLPSQETVIDSKPHWRRQAVGLTIGEARTRLPFRITYSSVLQYWFQLQWLGNNETFFTTISIHLPNFWLITFPAWCLLRSSNTLCFAHLQSPEGQKKWEYTEVDGKTSFKISEAGNKLVAPNTMEPSTSHNTIPHMATCTVTALLYCCTLLV